VLSVSWARTRDVKFSAAAGALLLLMAIGTFSVIALK
jgi:hypothetical protein